jgi:hypothetical protein
MTEKYENMNTNNSNGDDTSKQFIIDQLKWLGIYICIGFILCFFLPFPISLVGALAIYIIIYLYIRKRIESSRYGSTNRMKNIDSLSSSSSTIFDNEPTTIKYYCMNLW